MKEEISAETKRNETRTLAQTLRVKFENKAAVGEGPIREFFSTLMGFLHDGFPLDGASQEDHKLPTPMLSFVMQDFIEV